MCSERAIIRCETKRLRIVAKATVPKTKVLNAMQEVNWWPRTLHLCSLVAVDSRTSLLREIASYD